MMVKKVRSEIDLVHSQLCPFIDFFILKVLLEAVLIIFAD